MLFRSLETGLTPDEQRARNIASQRRYLESPEAERTTAPLPDPKKIAAMTPPGEYEYPIPRWRQELDATTAADEQDRLVEHRVEVDPLAMCVRPGASDSVWRQPANRIPQSPEFNAIESVCRHTRHGGIHLIAVAES